MVKMNGVQALIKKHMYIHNMLLWCSLKSLNIGSNSSKFTVKAPVPKWRDVEKIDTETR